MSQRTGSILKMLWDQIQKLILQIRTMAVGEDVHRLSWARRITDYDAVPDTYRFFFEPFKREGQAFPYTILTPTFEGIFQAQTTEKLVCILDRDIYILERTASTVKVYAYALEAISCVELKIVLLISQITLCGITQEGTPVSVTIKFNTVTEMLFEPLLEKIRRTSVGFDEGDLESEMRKFDYLETINFKFMNYARRTLLEGETVLQVILQPKVRARVARILGKSFYRIVSPAHLSILTDRELILIREEDNKQAPGDYGKVWRYIGLNKILKLSLTEENNALARLSIQLPEGARIENLFQASAKPEIDRFISRFVGIKTRT